MIRAEKRLSKTEVQIEGNLFDLIGEFLLITKSLRKTLLKNFPVSLVDPLIDDVIKDAKMTSEEMEAENKRLDAELKEKAKKLNEVLGALINE